MASEPTPSNSFSASRRWGIFLSVIISIVATCALVVMLNYLGSRYYKRFYWSTQTSEQLSPQTLALLKSITNQVKVIVYFDKTDDLYDSVTALLNEYHLANPKITVQKVDYLVDATRATDIKTTYKLGGGEVTNLVIFDCEGRHKTIPVSLLTDYSLETVAATTNGGMEMERHLTGFEGEKWFSAALINVVNPKQLKACFLQGDGEPEIGEPSDSGYLKFAQVLDQNNVAPTTIRLIGTNMIPDDCNLLIIAGPRMALQPEELDKIRKYLNQGGRMFIMFNHRAARIPTGLESILADWNVGVAMNVIGDPPNKLANSDVLSVYNFSTNHPAIAPLLGYSLAMVRPRAVGIAKQAKQGPEAPTVTLLAWTGPDATIGDDNPVPAHGNVPLIVAMEKSGIKGVLQERGSTAILVAGDSEFLSNGLIDVAANRDFAGLALNWLLDRTEFLKGVGPHPVKEYNLQMTNSQMKSVRWIFLAAMPGAILAFGGLVWFRRRR